MTKLGELVMILDLHRQGPSVGAIARQLSVDRGTVRAYIAKGWSRRSTKGGHQRQASSIRSKPICAVYPRAHCGTAVT